MRRVGLAKPRATHLNNILPDFTLPEAERELPAATVLQILFHKTKHTVSLKMPLESSTLNFMPFQYRLV